MKVLIVFCLFVIASSCSLSQGTEVFEDHTRNDNVERYVSITDSLYYLFTEELGVITQTLNFEIVNILDTDSTYAEELRNKVIYYTIKLDSYEAIEEVVYYEEPSNHISMINTRFEELLLEVSSKSVQFASIDKMYGENSFNVILVFDVSGIIKFYKAF